MESYYRKYITILFLTIMVFCIFTTAYVFFAIQLIINHNGEIMHQLAIFDVDKFKSINDTFGHATGDKVLRQVSQVILANIRGNDRLIRWGGDEFVVICVGVEESSQSQVANKLLNCIRALQMGTVQQPIRITLSMGFTSFSFSDKNYQQTMERVDEALYYSKAADRNRYTNYELMVQERREREAADKEESR